ncbi:hypothetical protein Hanom_Chr08g00704331 [Helianthus anomalus]
MLCTYNVYAPFAMCIYNVYMCGLIRQKRNCTDFNVIFLISLKSGGQLIMHHVVALIAERQKGTFTNRFLSRL